MKDDQISELPHIQADTVIDATGKFVIPGMIDDQVHFREPGLTDKADIRSESWQVLLGEQQLLWICQIINHLLLPMKV